MGVEWMVILLSREVRKVLSDQVTLEQRGSGRNWKNVTCDWLAGRNHGSQKKQPAGKC